MASIGDLFLSLLIDDDEVVPEVTRAAQKAGDAGARTLGERMSAGLKGALSTGFKAVGVAAAAGLGIASRAAIDAENAMASYRAETGATAEEAKDAWKAANQTAGDQRVALEEVNAASISVRKNLGATGDEAARLTDEFTEFARVTKQDSVGAVEDFDDILDAWGLTAKDVRRVQDQLLKSNQKYGGSITEQQKVLAELAPGLKAANIGYEDGIALLNLAAASGLDATKVVTGLNKSLTKIKSPAELEALIADISATEDPLLRAQKAADLFGAKAGPQLANALAGANLDDFRVDVEEAAGTVDEAADAIDSTFGARFQRILSQAGAKLRAFGADFGPAVTGLASFASLPGSLGLGRLFSGLKVPAGAKAFGGRIAAAVASGITGVGSTIADSVASGLDAMPGSSKVKGAIGRARKFLSSALGKGLAITVSVIAVVELVETFNQVKADIERQTQDLANQTSTFVREASLEALQNARKGVAEQLARTGNDPIAEFLGLSAKPGIERTLAELDAEIARRMAGVGSSAASALGANASAMKDAAKDAIYDPITGATTDAKDKAADVAADLPGDIAAAIRGKRDVVSSAFDQLLSDLEDETPRWKEVAETVGILTSEELAKGMRSKDPVVRAQAEETRRVAEERLRQLGVSGNDIGEETGQELKEGLNSKDPDVRAAAIRTRELIERNVKPKAPNVGAPIVTSLQNAGYAVGNAAYNLGQRIARNLLGGILYRGGGRAAKDDVFVPGKAAGGPVMANRPYIVGERRPELFVPETSGRIYPTVESGMAAVGASGPSNTWHVSIQAPDAARDPFEVAHQLRRIEEFAA